MGEHHINVARIVGMVVDLAEPLLDLADLFPAERRDITRNENYYEETIPNYTNTQFQEHFRMSRETFEVLLQQVQQFVEVEGTRIPLRKKLLFALWTISKQDSFLAAGDRFGLAKSSGHGIFIEMVRVIGRMCQTYINWPNLEAQMRIANVFEHRSRGIPGIIGAIDGCHIQIKQPEGNAIDYYNRKGTHSVILQGTCNDKGLFTDICIGMPGRMHDARVFRLSPLFNRLEELVPNNYHLIGDSAYPLLHQLMKPYQDNGHLSREQIHFNTRLSSVRSIIERTFGLLKGKFRRLKYLDVATPEMASEIILAACVLHNFIVLQENPQDNYLLGEIEDQQENNVVENNEPILQGAEMKRRELVNLCNRQ